MFEAARRIGYVSAASSNSGAYVTWTNNVWWRGNAAGLGGFFFACRFGIAQLNSTPRLSVGLATQIISGNPSSQSNAVCVGADDTDTTLQVMHNDGSGTCTKVNLGASFPANTTNTDWYEVRFGCDPNGSVIHYSVERLNTGDYAEGTLSTNLPVNTTFLNPQAVFYTGATAAAVALDLGAMLIHSDC
jgi:hypothetical protein